MKMTLMVAALLCCSAMAHAQSDDDHSVEMHNGQMITTFAGIVSCGETEASKAAGLEDPDGQNVNVQVGQSTMINGYKFICSK